MSNKITEWRKMNLYETPLEKEERLYKESRSLKFQARQLRKKRIERENRIKDEARIKAELAKSAALKAQADEKKDRDDRIRRAVLSFAETVKKEGLAFDSPTSSYAKMDAFTLLDKKSATRIKIYTKYNGFEWE